jgi:hypothetical protein
MEKKFLFIPYNVNSVLCYLFSMHTVGYWYYSDPGISEKFVTFF